MRRSIFALPSLTMSIHPPKIALRATSDCEEVGKVTATSFEAASRITGCDRWKNCGRRFDSTHRCRIEGAAEESTNVAGVRLERPLYCWSFPGASRTGWRSPTGRQDKNPLPQWRFLKTIISDPFHSRRPAPLRSRSNRQRIITLYHHAEPPLCPGGLRE